MKKSDAPLTMVDEAAVAAAELRHDPCTSIERPLLRKMIELVPHRLPGAR
jgi:hypothetical protein